MSGHYQTFPFQEGTEIFDSGTFSVFEAKRTSYFKDGLWDTHRGKILSNYHNQRKALVRSFRGTKKESRAECPAEVKKLRLVKEILEQCPHLQDVIRVPRTFYAEIDEVSMGCNVMSSDDCLKEGTCVVVHEIPEGKHAVFFFPERTSDDEGDIISLPHLLELAQTSFKMSGGRRVISEMKGVKVNVSETVVYFLTSVTVHSEEQEFGVRDEGLEGVRSFQSLAKLEEVFVQNFEEDSRHEESEHPEPSAPPAEDLEGRPDVPSSEDTSAKGRFEYPVNTLVPAATGTVNSTGGYMHEGVNLEGYPNPTDKSSCPESYPLSPEHIMQRQHPAESEQATLPHPLPSAPPEGQSGALSMSVPKGGPAQNQHASLVDVPTDVPMGPYTSHASVPENTAVNPNLSQENVLVNPFAHAATGTVYSTGGCVREGFSMEPRHVNVRANDAVTQTALPEVLAGQPHPLEQPSTSYTHNTAASSETQHSASCVPDTVSSNEEQSSTSQSHQAASSKGETPSASHKPHTASPSEGQPDASQGQHAAPARPHTLHVTWDVPTEQGSVESPPPDYESCVQNQARVPLSPPPEYSEKEETVAGAGGSKSDHVGPKT